MAGAFVQVLGSIDSSASNLNEVTASITSPSTGSVIVAVVGMGAGGDTGNSVYDDVDTDGSEWTEIHSSAIEQPGGGVWVKLSADGSETEVTFSTADSGRIGVLVVEYSGLDAITGTPGSAVSFPDDTTTISASTTPASQPGLAFTVLGGYDIDWSHLAYTIAVDSSFSIDAQHAINANTTYDSFVHIASNSFSSTSAISPEWSTTDAGGDSAWATTFAILDAAGGGTTLTVSDAAHAHTADNVALTQAYSLSVAGSGHEHSVGNISLTTQISVIVADAIHAHAVDNIDIQQANTLTVIDTLHDHTADNIALVSGNNLDVQEAAHSHVADNLDLIQAHLLAIDDTAHTHTVDNVDISQASVLSVAGTLHGHGSQNIDLQYGLVLDVEDAAHAQAAENIDLVQANILSVLDTVHAHTADNVDLVTDVTMIVSDALHAHLVDNVTLSLPGAVVTVPDSRIIVIEAQDRTFIITTQDRIFNIN